MDLAEFLLARIAEDEARVGPLHEHRAWWGGSVPPPVGVEDPCGACGRPRAEPVWSRVLAECQAKWRIVEMMREEYLGPEVLALLALPYADHQDYQPEWAPTVAV